MKQQLFALGALLAISGPSLAQVSDTYLLSLPLRQGDTMNDFCTDALERGDGFCNVVDMPIIGGSDTSDVVVFFRIGGLDQILGAARGDFVPWPWSDVAGDVMDHDFIDNPTLPVIPNPCYIIYCEQGTTCEWDHGQPLNGADCVGNAVFGGQNTTLGAFITIGSIKRLQIQDSLLNAQQDQSDRQTDDSICGKVMPPKRCMGTHILDDEGRIWDIP